MHRLGWTRRYHRNQKQRDIIECTNSLFREFVLSVNSFSPDGQCDCLSKAEDPMQNPPNFARTSKPDRSEIGQFNKSATTAFLDQFDQALARDKRRFPKGCGFAWFLLEQMLHTYLERHPRGWQENKPPQAADTQIDQSRLVLALMDDRTRRQRLHPLSVSLWQRLQNHRLEHQSDTSMFATIEHLLELGLDSSGS